MMYTKKGIMLKFLTTLVLALIIFIPACMFVSKFFSLSEQAKNNFGDFVSVIKEMQNLNVPIGDHKTNLLIMDSATAMVYFPAESKEVLVAVDAAAPYTDYTIHIQRPACDMGKKCLCLFREPEFETTISTPGYDTVTVTDKKAICEELDYNLKVANCGFGTANSVHSYKCTNGFMIERHLADGSSWAVSSYYEAPRRTTVQLIKEANIITIEEVGQK